MCIWDVFPPLGKAGNLGRGQIQAMPFSIEESCLAWGVRGFAPFLSVYCRGIEGGREGVPSAETPPRGLLSCLSSAACYE